MTAQELEKNVLKQAVRFGLLTKEKKDEEKNKNKMPNAVVRSFLRYNEKGDENTMSEDDKKGRAFWGYIRPEENTSGHYYDLSFVVFPQKDGGKCVIAIVVGFAGFQRDYDLASTAGTRRLFTRLTKSDGNSFIKNDFTDIDSDASDLLAKISNDVPSLYDVIYYYRKVFLASRIVDSDTEEGRKVIYAWLAQYAKLRNWGTNDQQRNAQKKAIEQCLNKESVDVQGDIKRLLESRRYVVLQGASGTGKTYNALKISESKEYEVTHFIQFHAETTYSDFVEGIRPKLGDASLTYEKTKGVLVEAIESALNKENKKVLLIIDEINRANLANVLGPVFYLFESQAGNRNVKLEVAGQELSKLPDNLYVIATMNTADRSLAVVDFALRRRFAWYTIRPQEITLNEDDKHVFHKDLFDRFCYIFDRYATDEELNLQPGPSYFLTPKSEKKDKDQKKEKEIKKEEEEGMMRDRLVYELMPLIKEYLAEGLMRKAANSFAQLFYEETGLYLYE